MNDLALPRRPDAPDLEFPRGPAGRAGVVAVLAALYVATYPALFRLLGPDVALVIVLGIAPASMAYGLRGGLLAGALAVPANALLLTMAGIDAGAALAHDWAGAVTGVAVALATGAGRDLLRRVRAQADALEQERLRLQQEVDRRQRTEADLQRANAELERARATAVAAAQAKTVLIGRASHELRTPVASVLGYVELMQEELTAGRPISLGPDLDRIHSAARHLSAVLDDLLELTRLETGHVTPRLQRVDASELLSDVASIAVPLVERRGNGLAVEVEPRRLELVTDRRRLEQVLLNLICNAGKFTSAGRITLSARAVPGPAGEALRLSVSDTGVGMTAEQAERAFDEFYQAHPSAAQQGTGLGLAITRQLCDLLGATIALDTTPGRGSTFTVTLPLAPPGG